MANNLVFGTYNVSSDGLTISYNAPAVLPKEVMDRISFNNDKFYSDQREIETSFDQTLKGVIAVPKPAK